MTIIKSVKIIIFACLLILFSELALATKKGLTKNEILAPKKGKARIKIPISKKNQTQKSHGTKKMASNPKKANAKKRRLDKSNNVALIPRKQFLKLTTKQKKRYLIGVIDLYIELEQKRKVFSSANIQISPPHFFDFLIPKTYADGNNLIGLPCVHSGNISEYDDINGRISCKAPPKGTCPNDHDVQCNPVFFGENICVRSNDQVATNTCLNNNGKDNFQDALKYIQSNPEDWERESEKLRNFCSSSGRWECDTIKARLQALEAELNNQTSSQTETDEQTTASTRETGPSEVAPATQQTPSTSGSGSGAQNTGDYIVSDGRPCDAILLIDRPFIEYSLRIDQTKYNPEHFILLPEQAQKLMCTNEPIDDQLRRALSAAKKKLSDGKAKAEREKRTNHELGSYHVTEIVDLQKNLESCKELAEKNRVQNRTYPRSSSVSANVSGYNINFSDESTASFSSQIALSLMAKNTQTGLDLCDVTFIPPESTRSAPTSRQGGTR